jgi:hypothetical protein
MTASTGTGRGEKDNSTNAMGNRRAADGVDEWALDADGRDLDV